MKIYKAARTAVFIALAVLVIIFIGDIAEIENLRYFIGALMIFYGVEEIAFTAVTTKRHYSLKTLYFNLVEIIIGITLTVFVETGDIEVTYAVVCVAWATWSILRESNELIEATEVFIKKKPTAYIILAVLNFSESLAVIALSLWMIIEPGEHHATIHLYMLAVELIAKVALPLAEELYEKCSEKHAALPMEGSVENAEPEAAVAEDSEN